MPKFEKRNSNTKSQEYIFNKKGGSNQLNLVIEPYALCRVKICLLTNAPDNVL
jgi:hypothetical protein